jgi:glycosyltransferase involved in cell wall biosynthesis
MENVYPEAMLTCFLSSREGFSKSLIESFSCGIPAIGYDVPGINNIIKNNENGILVKYKDHDELFKKVRYLIDHKNKISSYGSNARNIVEKKYSTDIINKKFISLWKQFLNN